MTTTTVPEVDDVAAYLLLGQLKRRLSEGEEPATSAAPQGMKDYGLHVVTSKRVLCVSSQPDYEVDKLFPIAEVVRAYPADDLGDWWTPSTDEVADFAGVSAAQPYALCERYADYFQARRDF